MPLDSGRTSLKQFRSENLEGLKLSLIKEPLLQRDLLSPPKQESGVIRFSLSQEKLMLNANIRLIIQYLPANSIGLMLTFSLDTSKVKILRLS